MKKNDPEIQPLNDDVLANMSIEELEERLELQILHMTEAQWCYDCMPHNETCMPRNICIIDFGSPKPPTPSKPMPGIFECSPDCSNFA